MASVSEASYKSALSDVLMMGENRSDRTGVGTRSLFGLTRIYDVSASFPLMTSKKMFFEKMVHELIWFINGKTNLKDLDVSVHPWWRDFADENGELGPVYGHQWRNWGGDQLAKLVNQINVNPMSRRLIVSAWNADEVDKMALPPCHTLFQVYVHQESKKMDMIMHQRSGDMFLGVPYNIASYSMLLMILCKITGYEPGRFIHNIGDAHIYLNHLDQVKRYIDAKSHPLPLVKISDRLTSLDGIDASMFELQEYKHEAMIAAPLAV
jgi:thymidylate synthase